MIKRARMSTRLLASAMLMTLAAACSDSSSNSGGAQPITTNVNGTVTAGVVAGSTVEVYRVDVNNRTLSFVSDVVTSATGTFNISISGSGPFLIYSKAGSFTDEATNTTVTLGTTVRLTSLDDARPNTMEGVIATGVNGGVTLNITPLTTIASRRIIAQSVSNNAAFDSTNVDTVHQAIGEEFGLGATTDPRGIFPIDFTDPANAAFIAANPTDTGVQLGLLLSGFSQLALDLSVNPLDLVDAASDDFQDGTPNGANGSVPSQAGNTSIGQNAFTNDLANSSTNFLNNNANNNSGTTAATFNAFIVTVSTLDVAPAANTAPFFDTIDDQTVTDSGSLVISGVSPGAPSSESTQTVTFTAMSSNSSVVATPTLTFTGNGSTRTLNFVIGTTGSSVITVSAMDSANSGVDTLTRSFTIFVNENMAPSFDMIQDQTVNEDSMNNTVSVTNLTATEAGQTVTMFTATSSNTAIVPDPVVTGAGATRTLTYSPVADQNGTVTITVTAMDNGGTANSGVDTFTQTFDIVVNEVNDAPTFDMIQDQTINEDSTGNMITIMNISTGPSNESGQMIVPITVTSSNTAIIPTPTVTGTGPTATFSIDPVANAFGTVTLTVIVQDDGGMANGGIDTTMQSFMVTVTEINDAPSFNMIQDVTVNEDSGTGTVTIMGVSPGPNETTQVVTLTATSSNTALIPNPTIANSVLSFTPATDMSGSAMITVMAMDDGGTVNGGMDTFMQTFTITVNPVNDAPSFTAVQSQTFDEDSMNNMVTIAGVSPGPADENGQTVTFTATSDNTAVVPDPMVAGNMLSFTPPADANGSAMITLTATDGGGTANGGVNTSAAQMFMVTITSINDAPTFDMIADQAVLAGAGQQMITITGVTTGAANESQVLTFTAVSDNQALVANPTITGSGTTRTLSYTPAAAMGGTATITVTLMDDGGTTSGGTDTTSDMFDIVVTVAPSISMIDPAVASSTGGTIIRVSTANFGQSFMTLLPVVTVGGVTATTVTAATATELDVTIPTGVAQGMNTSIVVTQAADMATNMDLNVVAPVAADELIINELLPNAVAIDVNGDGVTNSSQDEFVEIVNVLTTPVDISEFELNTTAGAVHIFDNPTIIPAGGSIVVFGGGAAPNFPAANMNGSAQFALNGALALDDTTDTVTIFDAGPTNMIHSITYNGPTADISLNRMIDGDIGTAFVNHGNATGAVGNFSPGFKVDGVTRHNGAPVPSIDMVVPAVGRVSGGTTIAVTVSTFGDLTADMPTVMIGGMTVTANGVTANAFTFDVPTGLTVGTTTISVMNTAGTATFMTFEVVAAAVAGELIINEYMPNPNNGTVILDTNNDGTGDASQDEYIELRNTRSTAMDISGFTLADSQKTFHTFANPTTIPAGGTIVVFGGGTPTGFAPLHSSGHAQLDNGGFGGFGNGGDSITLADDSATVFDSDSYTGASITGGEALNRTTDGVSGPFIDHSTVTGAVGTFSPGNAVDGNPFP